MYEIHFKYVNIPLCFVPLASLLAFHLLSAWRLHYTPLHYKAMQEPWDQCSLHHGRKVVTSLFCLSSCARSLSKFPYARKLRWQKTCFEMRDIAGQDRIPRAKLGPHKSHLLTPNKADRSPVDRNCPNRLYSHSYLVPVWQRRRISVLEWELSQKGIWTLFI